MAFQCASYSVLRLPAKPKFEFVVRKKPVVLCSSFRRTQASYNTLVSEVPFSFPLCSFHLFLGRLGLIQSPLI